MAFTLAILITIKYIQKYLVVIKQKIWSIVLPLDFLFLKYAYCTNCIKMWLSFM